MMNGDNRSAIDQANDKAAASEGFQNKLSRLNQVISFGCRDLVQVEISDTTARLFEPSTTSE